MTKIQVFLLGLLLLASLLVRIYRISESPPSLYIDEIDYGLQARSLIETGKDYRGEQSPFWVHSFNDIRTPIPVYFTIISTLLFKSPELEIRGPSIILGVVIVLTVFLLVKIWTKRFAAAFLTAFVFAFNPWQLQFSRFAHEAISMLVLYLIGSYFLFKSLNSKNFKFLILSALFFSLSVYVYRTMSLFVPLSFIIIFLIYKKDLLSFGIKKLLLVIFLSAAIILPFLYATTLGAPDTPRIAQLSITSDPEIPIWVQRNREVDSGDYQDKTVGKNPTKSSFFFHSKPLSWLDAFSNNYFQTFSTDFFFISGDRNLRHNIGQTGHLYAIDFIGLIFGFVFIAKNFKKKEFKWLTALFFTAPIASSITADGGQHAARLFIFSAPLLLVIGLGWWHFFESVRNLKYLKYLLVAVFGIWLLLFVFYLHRYFVHYPIESARYFGYGFKQAMTKIVQLEPNYKRIAMVSTKDPPMIYYLFWSKKNPKLIQEYGLDFSEKTTKNSALDKYKVVDWPSGIGEDSEVARYLRADTLYLVSTHEFPQNPYSSASPPSGVKIIDVIRYPDNEIVFYLITREPSYQTPNTEPKFKDIGQL